MQTSAVEVPGDEAGAATLEGQWSGSIVFPNFELSVRVALAREGEGWAGHIDIPMQSAHDLPLEGVRVVADSLWFELPSQLGRAYFTGQLEGPDAIGGTFRQAGLERPFELLRVSSTAEVAAPGTEAAPAGVRPRVATEDANDPLHAFDALVDSIRIAYRVPGCAVVVVRGQEVALDAGFGQRDVESDLPVTPNTLFAIGSATKSFTALLLGTFVERGLLSWSEPIIDYLPDFRMYDDVATQRLTTRDLVSHRTGLPRHDLVWYASQRSRGELYDCLRYLVPNHDIRESFQYTNLMFVVAGVLAERLGEASWETLVRDRIFTPAGMSRANFSVVETQADPDHSHPYALADGEVVEVPFRDLSAIGPAGSINACAADMARWLRLLIQGGQLDGHVVVSPAGLEDLFVPRTVVSQAALDPDEPIAAYASGWFVQPYRGTHRVHHGGNIDGFTSLVTLLPHDEIGIVVLANREASPLPEVVTRIAMDRLLDLEPRDWAGEGLASLAATMTIVEAAEQAPDPTRTKDTRPSHRLDEYAGTYEHPGYGVMDVVRDDDRLRLDFHTMVADLEHWHYDVFRASSGEKALDGMLFAFMTNPEGDVASVSAPMETQVDPIVFTRVPDSPLDDPALLDAMVGEYVLGAQVVTVGRRGERTLTLNVPGQPLYVLEPYRDLEFRLEGISGYKVRFGREGTAGPITRLVFVQPNGVFTAMKR